MGNFIGYWPHVNYYSSDQNNSSHLPTPGDQQNYPHYGFNNQKPSPSLGFSQSQTGLLPSGIQITKDDNHSLNQVGKDNPKTQPAVTKIPEFTSSSVKNSNNPKLSYTPFQLELLNLIYSKWKHPKAEQKTFISKVVGITRKQTMVRKIVHL